MAADTERDTSRTRVQTYVPAYQREEWEQRAESMDMSLSEFVRTMVQAGKRGFDADVEDSTEPESRTDPSSTLSPQGSHLEDRVRSALTVDEYVDWDELVDGVQREFEDELGTVLDELLEDGEVEHRHGRGYALA